MKIKQEFNGKEKVYNLDFVYFEDLNYYKARFKRNRISKDIVIEYMRRLGIKFYDIDKDITDCLNFIRTQW